MASSIYVNPASGNVGIGTTNTANGILTVVGGGSSTPFIVTQSGNVGIGITNPSLKLDVAGDMCVSNQSYYKCKNAAGTAVNILGVDSTNTLRVNGGGGSCYICPDSTSTATYINTNNNSPTIINYGNNVTTYFGNAAVGINTNNPGATLDVNGNLNISGSLQYNNANPWVNGTITVGANASFTNVFINYGNIVVTKGTWRIYFRTAISPQSAVDEWGIGLCTGVPNGTGTLPSGVFARNIVQISRNGPWVSNSVEGLYTHAFASSLTIYATSITGNNAIVNVLGGWGGEHLLYAIRVG